MPYIQRFIFDSDCIILTTKSLYLCQYNMCVYMVNCIDALELSLTEDAFKMVQKWLKGWFKSDIYIYKYKNVPSFQI